MVAAKLTMEGPMRLAVLIVAALAAASCNRDDPPTPATNDTVPAAPANAAAPTAGTDRPSFDCARADGQAQELVCSNPGLAAMDRELDRLFRLAAADPGLAADVRDTLAATQRGWIKGRDDCWKDDELRQCVSGAYATRIHQLREASAAARGDAADALSVGPVAFRCGGLGPVAATFVNSDPGAVFLQWGPTSSVALDQAPSGSGARYAGRVAGDEWVFWNKGREATFTMPGRGDLSCAEAGAG